MTEFRIAGFSQLRSIGAAIKPRVMRGNLHAKLRAVAHAIYYGPPQRNLKEIAAMSLQGSIAQYVQTVDTILASGPDIQADLDDLKEIVARSRAIKDRTIKRFGLSGDAGALSDERLEAVAAHPDVLAANERLAKALGLGAGVKGPFADILLQLVQLVATNPALLQLLLSLFKKPAGAIS